jgi:hypothetical protein
VLSTLAFVETCGNWRWRMSPTGKAKGTIRVLKLQRETLRELDAAELKQAQGGPGQTGAGSLTCKHCTRGCPSKKKC